jgi:PST family polysaccharide transporter
VYSLALQTLIAAALTTVQLWIAGAASVFGIPKWKGFAEFLGFGGRLTLFSVVNYFSRNADNLLIGKYLGDVALGIYSMAYKIMLFPVQNLTFVAGRSLLPVLSRKQGNLREVWATYLKASSMIAMLAAPLFFLTITFRWEVVRVAFGDGWLAVPPLLLWLCLVGTIQVQMSLTGSVLIALGKTALHLRLGVLSAVTQVVAFVAGIHWGMEALVKLYLLSNIVNSVFVYPALFQSVKGNAGEYLRALMIPYASGLLLWSVFAFLRGQMVSLQLSPIAIVLVGGAGFMCAYLSLCWLFARSNCLDLLSMVKPGRQVEG